MVNNHEQEKLVIGGLIMSEEVRTNARGILNSQCFTLGEHQGLFEAISELDKQGDNVDMISVMTYYNAHSENHIETYDLLEYTDKYVGTGLDSHIRDLITLSIRRNIRNTALTMLKDCEDITVPVEDIQRYIQKETDKMFLSNKDGIITLAQSCDKVLETVYDNMDAGQSMGIPTGFRELDKAGGFHPGDLVVIAAESSQGKSSLALSIARNMILSHNACTFYSMEMMHYQLTARIASMQSGIKSSDILYNPLSQTMANKVVSELEYVRPLPLYYDDKSNSSLSRIMASIRNMVIKKAVRCVFIDYIQLIRKSERNMSDEQWIATVARDLKNLAKELEIPIVVLSQLNRDRESPEPSVNRLRGSGQINEAADTVLLIYRPEYYHKNFPEPFSNRDTHNAAMIKIGKGRNIGVGEFTCKFIPELTMFVDEDAPISTNTQNKETNTQNDLLPF